MNPEQLEDIYELTPLQEGMLFHSLYAPEAGLYFEQLCFELHGALQVDVFQEAWNYVIARHSTLRTAVEWEGLEKPYQVVYRTVDPQWEVQDWRDRNATEQAQQLNEWLQADRKRGFVFSEAPLLRFGLIRQADNIYQFVWSIHHLVIDGWSWPLVMREIFLAYESLSLKQQPRLPQAPPYRQYIEWLQNQDRVAAAAFWKEYLQGFTAPTALSVATVPDVQNTHPRFDHDQLKLSESSTRALNQVGAAYQVTLSNIVKCAWALLLNTYNQENDVVFGSVVAGRPPLLTDVESTVGFFMNSLPLRVRIDDQVNVLEVIKQVQSSEMALGEYEYSSLSEIQQWSEVPRGAALFESVLAFENYPVGRSTTALGQNIKIQNVRAYDLTNYPLTIAAVPGKELQIDCIYDCDRFEAQSIQSILRHLGFLLELIGANPSAKVRELPLLKPAEVAQQIFGWNNTSADAPEDQSLPQLVERYARENPNGIAVEFDNQKLSYAEFNACANQLADFLVEKGVGPEIKVGVCLDRSLDLIISFLAIAKAGGAWVPLDASYPPARLASVCRDSEICLLLTHSSLAHLFSGDSIKIVKLDEERDELKHRSKENFTWPATARNAAYMIYTSGSTGQPKGVIIEHRSLSVFADAQQAVARIIPEDRVLQFASSSFDASVLEMALAFKAGATLVLVKAAEIKTGKGLYEVFKRERISAFFSSPSILASLPGNDLSALRLIFAGGEACSAELVDRWAPGRRLYHIYGVTEATVWNTYELCYAGMGHPSVGEPLNNVRVYILDRYLRPVPTGVKGEIYIGGIPVGRGYHNRPELNLERFIADPFRTGSDARLYKTGDLGRLRHDGKLEFVGRLDHQVKLRGFRIELGEISTLLSECGGVAENVVVVREDRPGDQRLIAYVAPHQSGALSVADIRSYLKDRLPQFMVPRIVILDTLPKNSSGKVDRRALPDPEEIAGATGLFAPPQSEMESKIASVWQEFLKIERVGRDDNFFDLGGHSLLITQVYGRLKELLDVKIAIVDLFHYPTVSSLAAHLTEDHGSATSQSRIVEPSRQSTAKETIAIVGMCGRFPGAGSIDQLLENLRNGVESVRFFSEEELCAAGVDAAELADPQYVRAGTVLDGYDQFDAKFFGFNPREAAVTDPQQRLFLECAHEALEDAGYDPHTCDERIGVFAGTTISSYLIRNLLNSPGLLSSGEVYQTVVSNDKDFLATRVAYKLGLKGPALTVQTACSTSLVAVHMACKSLLNGECDIALAGGVSLNFPQPSGYIYQREGIRSPDGHCRAFDSAAAGTIGGNGLALVVLKRLSAAIGDGDTIHAVISGSAINNDGSEKVGYTAPSVAGQASVILQAQEDAGFDPGTITCIEAHGTGTQMGDPIEIAALTKAFRRRTQERQFCAIGSVKTNLGHMDAAAGVTGLIKATLQLREQELFPSLHFKHANPALDLETSPFFVNTELRNWEEGPTPRRAGVSSFGIGGTNAHVVLEQAPNLEPTTAGREWQIIPFSAGSEAAWEKSIELVNEVLQTRKMPLEDLAYTLQVGRTAYRYRGVIVSQDRESAVCALTSRQFLAKSQVLSKRPVAFLFPGQGAQYRLMGKQLYDAEPVFKEAIDRCAEVLKPHLRGQDLRMVLFSESEEKSQADLDLNQTVLTQPVLFTLEYALAQLWLAWGIAPESMIGHSVGEYVAACLSEVISLEDALQLVSARGRLMQSLPCGAMLAVELSEAESKEFVSGGLDLAAVNNSKLCVLSGPSDKIAAAEERLIAQNVGIRRLHTSHAFHSAMVEPILKEFRAEVDRVQLRAPRIPYVSNVTGTWIRPEEATSPDYWVRHMRHCVRFADGVGELLSSPDRILLEVGPGQTLSSLTKLHENTHHNREIVASMPRGQRLEAELQSITEAVARLWAAGAGINWRAYHSNERRLRIPLPTYPFERQRFWIEPQAPQEKATETVALSRSNEICDWLYAPSWRRKTGSSWHDFASGTLQGKTWLVFARNRSLAESVRRQLSAIGASVILAHSGEEFQQLGAKNYVINLKRAEDHLELLRQLSLSGSLPTDILYLSALASGGDQDVVFHSVLSLAQALGSTAIDRVNLTVVSDAVHRVIGSEKVAPDQATLLGLCAVIPQEYSKVQCRFFDVLPEEDFLSDILSESISDKREPIVSFRGGYRWVRNIERLTVPATSSASPVFRNKGVYLITGGLSGIGLACAEYLAKTCQARLALIGRSNSEQDSVRRTVSSMEKNGAEVLILRADVADAEAIRWAVREVQNRFGSVHGVIHSAGVPGGGTIQFKSREDAEGLFAPKITGTKHLFDLLKSCNLDFFVLCSSLASILGGPGQADYAAANAFLNAFAQSRNPGSGAPLISICWDTWRDTGMAVRSIKSGVADEARQAGLEQGLSSAEGMKVLELAIRLKHPETWVSTRELSARIEQERIVHSQLLGSIPANRQNGNEREARPTLQNTCVAPQTELQCALAAIWQNALGIQEVGIHDNFFELGGHSLLLLRIQSEIQAVLGLNVSSTDFLRFPTIATLAEHVGKEPETVPAGHGEQRANSRLQAMERRREHRRTR